MSEGNQQESQLNQMSDEEVEMLRAYMVFSNGDGLKVFEDLMYTFNEFSSDAFNEELEEIPHPYREYVKAGCRLVMKKISTVTKLAVNNRG